MPDIIEDSFKEQISTFYYANLRRVAQALFDDGANIQAVAENLGLTIPMAKRWHDLYEKGEFFKTDAMPGSNDLNLPFAYPSNEYIWKDYAHEVKCAAKIFFEMGLGCRAIAIYLGVPPGTVYWWQSLYKKKQFKFKHRQSLGRFLPQGEKFTYINNRKYYSSEIRQTAYDCFKKGMSAYEVAKYLDIPDGTTYSWHSLFKKGRFYTENENKHFYRKSIWLAIGQKPVYSEKGENKF